MQNHVCQVYLQGIALCKYEHVTCFRSMFLNLTFLFPAEQLTLFLGRRGCAGSSWLHRLFSSCGEWGYSSCGARVSHCGGFSHGVQTLEHQLTCGARGVVAP